MTTPIPTSAPATSAVGDESATARWLARDHEALAGVLPRYYDVVAERGEGSWIIDVDGRRFLDLGAGIAVNATGHCHPRVVDAVVEQARTLLHTSVVVHHRRNVELAERLGGLCPFFAEPQVFFCNSGAEAVDGALKLARKTTGRPDVVAFRRAFHGRTLAATTLTTAKGRYREGYAPLFPGVYHAPYCIPHEHDDADAALGAALDGLDCALRPPGAARERRGDDRRARAGRGWLRRPAAGVAPGPPRPLRRARHPARVRRGAVRRRPHRSTVRRRDVRCDARRAAVRQGHRIRVAAGWHRRRPAPAGPVADRYPRLDLRRQPGRVRGRHRHARRAGGAGLLPAGRRARHRRNGPAAARGRVPPARARHPGHRPHDRRRARGQGRHGAGRRRAAWTPG